MPNTSASDSLCFHLDYQTNAPSSLKVIPCVLRTSRKMNVHWKRHVSQYKKKKKMIVIKFSGYFATFCMHQFSSVQSLSRVRLFENPSITACQASLSQTPGNPSRLQMILQSYSNQSVILAQQQTYGSIKQNQRPEVKPHTSNLWQRMQDYTRGKRQLL